MPQQYVVPQFIDVEDKIIGPITVRQFVLMIAGGLFLFLFYKIFIIPVFIVCAIFIIGIVGLFGFAKVNSHPFHVFLVGVLQTLRRPKRRIWNKELTHLVSVSKDKKKDKKEKLQSAAPTVVRKPVVGKSRLAELSLLSETGGRYTTDLSEIVQQPTINSEKKGNNKTEKKNNWEV